MDTRMIQKDMLHGIMELNNYRELVTNWRLGVRFRKKLVFSGRKQDSEFGVPWYYSCAEELECEVSPG